MIQLIVTKNCPERESDNIIKNGKDYQGDQKFQAYRGCQTFSDFWEAYQKVFATGKHHSVGKESGETAHVERWNLTLRQRLARFVRKTLSFSKLDFYHELVLRMFIVVYNMGCIS